MGSISGFKEYVGKEHPACPLCGGATEKKRIMDDEKDPNLGDLTRTPTAGETYGRFPNIEKRSIVGGSIQECVNCGAQHEKGSGKILRGSN